MQILKNTENKPDFSFEKQKNRSTSWKLIDWLE
jgi:hypothetical protein